MAKLLSTVYIQVRYKKQTYLLTVNETSRVSDIKKELYTIIQARNGLEPSQGNDEGDGDDLDIPVPSFDTGFSDDEDENVEITDANSHKNKSDIPDIGDLVLGQPKDLSDLSSGFKDLQDENVKLSLQDGSILALRLYDEKYQVEEYRYSED